MATQITKRLTIEQLASDTKSRKIKFKPAFIGSGDAKTKLCFDGTDVQKYSVVNEAGNTLAWLSKKVCEDLHNGQFQKDRALQVLISEGTDDETGEMLCFTTIGYEAVVDGEFSIDSLYD